MDEDNSFGTMSPPYSSIMCLNTGSNSEFQSGHSNKIFNEEKTRIIQARSEVQSILQKTDAILELNAFQTLRQFINLGGTPPQVIEYLTESYRGYAEMCKLVAHWLTLADFSNEEIVDTIENHILKMIIAKFDSTKVDRLISEGTKPLWLSEIIKFKKWRYMIYELSDHNRDCLFLNYCIQLISATGYDQEIASLPSASTNFDVYNRVLSSAIKKILEQGELTLSQHLNNFCKLSGHCEHSYLYTQALLHAISAKTNKNEILRISQAMEDYMQKSVFSEEDEEKTTERRRITRSIMFHMTCIHSYPTIAISVENLLSSNTPSPADVRKLYYCYNEIDRNGIPPLVKYIQRQEILSILISQLFNPEYQLPHDFIPQYLWLLAYAATVDDTRSILVESSAEEAFCDFKPDLESVSRVEKALKAVYNVCQKNYFGTELAREPVDIILKYLHIPIVSMSVLYWIKINLTDPDKVSTAWNTKSLQTYLGIWKEIVFLNPSQWIEALNVLVSGSNGQSSLGSVEALNSRRSIIEALVFLVQCGCVFPVVHQIQEWMAYSDPALTKHFLITLLPLIEPPYSIEFLEILISIIGTLKIDPVEHGDIFRDFVQYVLDNHVSELEKSKVIILQNLKLIIQK